jgi:hypothetical protein
VKFVLSVGRAERLVWLQMGSLRNASFFIRGNFDEIESGNFGYETGLVWHISLFYLERRKGELESG